MCMNTPLDRAIAHIGSAAALAEMVGVSKQAVSKWRRKQVPAGRCKAIELVTGGSVTAIELRADVFGDASVDGSADA